jgi:1-acyl-sn-glycerol-3-phosphate acyltransferase
VGGPRKAPLAGLEYRPDGTLSPMDRVYGVVVRLALFVLRLMRWEPRVSGLEHVPKDGPALIACNHIGLVDWIFLGRSVLPVGRLVRFMAKKEAFDHWLGGPLLRAMQHLPVDRFGSPEQALAPAVDALRRGELVGIFPEGTISRSLVPAEGRTGAARIAMEAGAPLVPAAVWGSHRILTAKHYRGLVRPGIAVSVRFGPPVGYRPDEDPAVVTHRLMAAIRELFDRAVAEYPQRPGGPRDTWWMPAELGGSAVTVTESNRLADVFRRRRRAARRNDEAN